jgi:hypothetical protein
MRRAMLVVLVSALISLPCVAKDVNGHYVVLSMGTKTCGEYVSDFKADERGKLDNSIWVAGFLTAYNIYTKGTKNISRNTDPAAWDLWINNYCERNPLDQVADAAVALVKELKSRQ